MRAATRSGLSNPRDVLDGFVDRTDRVLALIEGFMPEAEWLDDDETLTYLHSCISTRRQRVRVPETRCISTPSWSTSQSVGGLEPRLGDAHLRTLTVMGFPVADLPGLARRAQPTGLSLPLVDARDLPRQDRRRQDADPHPPAVVRQAQVDHGDPEGGDDQRGVGAARLRRRQQGARRRRGAAGAGLRRRGPGLCHRDGDGLGRRSRASPTRSCALVEKIIQGRDFTCMRETVNAVEAWLGSLPGHVYANVRQPPISHPQPRPHDARSRRCGPGRSGTSISTRPPLFFARTEGATPFRFSLHVGDVGHALVVGPTGAGKSVLLALMALQFRRYPRRAGLRLRLRRLDPRGRARHGRRLARSRRRARRRWRSSPSPCSRWPASTMPASAPGPPNGSRRCWPASASPSRRTSRSIYGPR